VRSHERTRVLALLALGILVLLGLFHAEVVAALKVWSESTAFGHCYLVLPIAAWLAWERRAALLGLTPQPVPSLAVLAVPLVCIWFAADRLGIMEGRQFALLGLVWLLVLAVVGLRICAALAAPLAYLVFLVPFGAFLVPSLQDFTARFIDFGLDMLDIPHIVTAVSIEIPEGNFEVAAACAGLRFLIAAIAFGALYACIIYRSTPRRLAFIAACVVVPILANGVRALGIVVVGHIKGSAQAGAVDHILYGWLFFTIVLLLLLLLGLPFRQDTASVKAAAYQSAPHRQQWGAAAITVSAVLLLAACGPAAASWLDQRGQVETASLAGEAERLVGKLVPPAGCILDSSPHAVGASQFDCGGRLLAVQVRLFGPAAGVAVLAAWRDTLQWESDEDPETRWLDTPAGAWQLASTHDPHRSAVAVLWMNGTPQRPGLALRLRLALAIFHPSPSDRLVLLTAQSTGPNSQMTISNFAAAQSISTTHP
jgi:exosortase A